MYTITLLLLRVDFLFEPAEVLLSKILVRWDVARVAFFLKRRRRVRFVSRLANCHKLYSTCQSILKEREAADSSSPGSKILQ